MQEQKSDYDFNPMPPSRFNNGRNSYKTECHQQTSVECLKPTSKEPLIATK